MRPTCQTRASIWSMCGSFSLRLDEIELGGPGEPGWISDPEELARLLIDAGFVDVTLRVGSHAVAYADLDEYWRAAHTTGERRRLAKLDGEQTEQVRRALAAFVARYQHLDGLHIPAAALQSSALSNVLFPKRWIASYRHEW